MDEKLVLNSPSADKVRRRDNTLCTGSDVMREGLSGGHADGVLTEFITIGVGLSKALYIEALKDCSIGITGYLHSTLIESNKFSALEAYFLGIEANEIIPQFGPGVFDLIAPRNVDNKMDGVNTTTQVKRPYSQTNEQPRTDIIVAKLGDYLTSDAVPLTTFIHQSTTATPLLLLEDTLIAQSQSASDTKKVGYVNINQGQRLLIVFTNVNTIGTNEAVADLHVTLQYAELKL